MHTIQIRNSKWTSVANRVIIIILFVHKTVYNAAMPLVIFKV